MKGMRSGRRSGARVGRLVLVLLMIAGCGVAAHPLSARGVKWESQVPDDPSKTAWVVCPRGRAELPTGTMVVVRYRSCAVVVGSDVAPQLGRAPQMRLGRASDLRKTDAGVLLKALMRWEVLHLDVRHDEDPPDGAYDHPSHREAGCTVRGMPFDYDCPRASIPKLLAHEHVTDIVVWNRFWVRWK